MMQSSPSLRVILVALVAFSLLLTSCGAPNIESLEERGDMEGLEKALENEDPGVVIAAIEALARIAIQSPLEGYTRRTAIDNIAANIIHDDLSVGLSAIAALGTIPDTLAAEKLRFWLDEDDPDRQGALIEALAAMGPVSVMPLVEGLHGGILSVRITPAYKEGVFAVLTLLGEEGVPHVLYSLEDGPLEVREFLTSVLDAMQWQPGTDEHAAYYWIAKQAWEECAAVGAGAVAPLLDVYSDSEIELSEEILAAISHIRDPEAIMPLAEILAVAYENPDKRIFDETILLRAAAATSIAAIGGTAAIDPLLNTLVVDEGHLRQVVLQGLARLTEPQIAELQPALDALAPICEQGEDTDLTQLDSVLSDPFYPLIVLNEDGKVNAWTAVHLLRHTPASPSDELLVACLSQDYVWAETCSYMGASNISRSRDVIHIDLWDTTTGEKLGRETFVGHAMDCPLSRYDWHIDHLYGAAKLAEIDDWFAEYLP